MNKLNALPRDFRHRVRRNILATVKNRILDADTQVSDEPITAETAHVDEQLLEQFHAANAPLEEP